MLDRAERAEERGRVYESVEPAELRTQCSGDIVVVGARRLSEVERKDRRLRMPGSDNLVVDRLELAHDASVQHDRGALSSTCQGQRAPETAAGARDEDGATGEINGGRSGGGGQRHWGSEFVGAVGNGRRRPR